jgi:aminotransferase
MINVFGAKVGDEEMGEIQSSIDSSWMGCGVKVKLFEESLSKRNNLQGLVMVDSGSNALILAIKLLKLPPKSTIVVPSFTWVACANSVILAGHKVRFADVDYDTQNITENTVAKALDLGPIHAIMVVHYAGLPVEMNKLNFGVPIIEDAAHAIDSKVGDKYCGSLGNVAIYSFDSIKNLATPEGGAVITNDDLLTKKAREYRYCGITKSGFAAAADNANGRWWEHQTKYIWPKMMPNDISASIGLAQLAKLDSNQKKRKEIWDRYQVELENVNWLLRPKEANKNDQHSYFTYFIRVLNGRRDELAKYLLDNGVYTTLRYYPLHLNSIYRSKQSLPVSEMLNNQGLSIPLHPALSDNDVSKVIDLIKEFDG